MFKCVPLIYLSTENLNLDQLEDRISIFLNIYIIYHFLCLKKQNKAKNFPFIVYFFPFHFLKFGCSMDKVVFAHATFLLQRSLGRIKYGLHWLDIWILRFLPLAVRLLEFEVKSPKITKSQKRFMPFQDINGAPILKEGK